MEKSVIDQAPRTFIYYTTTIELLQLKVKVREHSPIYSYSQF